MAKRAVASGEVVAAHAALVGHSDGIAKHADAMRDEIVGLTEDLGELKAKYTADTQALQKSLDQLQARYAQDVAILNEKNASLQKKVDQAFARLAE